MKRVVSSSLVSVFIIIAIAVGIIYYQQYSANNARVFDCIPADASLVISCKQTSAAIRQLNRSSYWKELSSSAAFARANNQLTFFDSIVTANVTLREALTTHPLWLSLHVTGATDFDLLFLSENITTTDADLWLNTLTNTKPTLRNYNGIDIRELNTSFGLFSYAIIRGVWVGSFSPFLVEDAVRQQRSGIKPKDLTLQAGSDPVLFINHHQLPAWLSVFLTSSQKDKINNLGAFAASSALAISIRENEIGFNGITQADTADYLHSLRNQKPVSLSIKQLLPAKTAAFIWFGISDWKEYLPELRNYFKLNKMQGSTLTRTAEIEQRNRISLDAQWLYWLGNEYALVITEPVSTNYDNTSYALFKANDVSKAIAALGRLADKANAASGNKQQNEESYNGHVIHYLDLPGLLPALFGGLFNRINRFYYTDMKGYIIVANQPSALRSLINDNATGNMAVNDVQMNASLNHFNAPANFGLYVNPSASTYLMRSIASASTITFIEQNKKAWSRCDALIYSATVQNNAFKTDAYFHYKTEDKKGVHQLWSCLLDTTVTNMPQFVNDDTTQPIKIMVQDDNNMLYKIDNTGSIQWKKQLDTRVVSTYYTVNPHKSRQQCCLFNTRSFIYMLDAEGNNCPGYPIRLPAEATTGLSLVDYYGNGDYRIFLACGNRSYNGWLLNGKPLGGWYFTKTQNAVTDSLQYFRFGAKDYLVFTDAENNFYALNKMGQRQLKEMPLLIKKPGTRFYSLGDDDTTFQLMLMDTSGALVIANTQLVTTLLTAEQTQKPLAWLPMDVNGDNQNDFVLMKERSLKILSNDNLTLAAHTFTDSLSTWIKSFTLIDGKTRIALYSAQAATIYLMEKDGSITKGFPVSGATPFDVLNVPLDNRSYLVTGAGNSIYLYGIN